MIIFIHCSYLFSFIFFDLDWVTLPGAHLFDMRITLFAHSECSMAALDCVFSLQLVYVCQLATSSEETKLARCLLNDRPCTVEFGCVRFRESMTVLWCRKARGRQCRSSNDHHFWHRRSPEWPMTVERMRAHRAMHAKHHRCCCSYRCRARSIDLAVDSNGYRYGYRVSLGNWHLWSQRQQRPHWCRDQYHFDWLLNCYYDWWFYYDYSVGPLAYRAPMVAIPCSFVADLKRIWKMRISIQSHFDSKRFYGILGILVSINTRELVIEPNFRFFLGWQNSASLWNWWAFCMSYFFVNQMLSIERKCYLKSHTWVFAESYTSAASAVAAFNAVANSPVATLFIVAILLAVVRFSRCTRLWCLQNYIREKRMKLE